MGVSIKALNRIMLLAFLALSCLVFHADCFAADDDGLNQAFETQDGFTIYLPDNWVAIPRNIVDDYLAMVKQAAPNAKADDFDYAFQLKAEGWFEYPYIFVKVKKTGRIPGAQLKTVKKIGDRMNGAVGEAVYDPSAHILFTRLSMNYQWGPVEGLNASILTEEGMINVFCYSKQSEAGVYLPVFESIARKVAIAESLQYKVRLSDSAPPKRTDGGRVLGNTLAGAVLGGIWIWLVGLNARRKALKNQGK